MKLEDLKNLQIAEWGRFSYCLKSSDHDDEAVKIGFGYECDFDDPQTALLAAAHFRASRLMYQALLAAVDAHDADIASSVKYAEARGEIVHIIEPEWVEQARKALALADNTNETLNTNEK